MARANDHDQRDAEHALRAETTLVLAKYARRILAEGKAIVAEAIADAIRKGEEIDGTQIGRIAAAKVAAKYLGPNSFEPAIETTASPLQLDDPSEAGLGRSSGLEFAG